MSHEHPHFPRNLLKKQKNQISWTSQPCFYQLLLNINPKHGEYFKSSSLRHLKLCCTKHNSTKISWCVKKEEREHRLEARRHIPTVNSEGVYAGSKRRRALPEHCSPRVPVSIIPPESAESNLSYRTTNKLNHLSFKVRISHTLGMIFSVFSPLQSIPFFKEYALLLLRYSTFHKGYL